MQFVIFQPFLGLESLLLHIFGTEIPESQPIRILILKTLCFLNIKKAYLALVIIMMKT